MANCVSVMTKILRKRHDLRTHKQQAVSDWLNPLSLGSMSASGYIANCRPGVNLPSTIPNPILVDFLIPNPIPVNLAVIPNPIPIPVIFPSAIPTPNRLRIQFPATDMKLLLGNFATRIGFSKIITARNCDHAL